MKRIEDGNNNDMKTVIKVRLPMVIGIPVYSAFDDLEKSNPIYDTDLCESKGNHAIVLIIRHIGQQANSLINY